MFFAGEDVRWLQARLTTIAKIPVPGTSVFDEATEAMDEASAALPKAA